MSFFPYRKSKTLRLPGLAVILLSLSAVGAIEAQSGRRTAKPVATPAPQPIALPEYAPKPTSHRPITPLNEKVKLLIGRHRTKRRLLSEDTIFASFVNRLIEDPNIIASTIGDVERNDAVVRARTETDSMVVLLSFEVDTVQDGTIVLNSPDLQVEYQIHEPVTGKKLAKGKVYFQAIGGARARRSEWPGGTPIKITAEAAGIDAADHVHDWLRLAEVQRKRPKKN
ncbi:MAG TPA: hypothetical protein VJV03_17945 [Pyrinomonadaceae bacterium]|nr:hypothetical protein [Pyrinomonadaceae bacterium]